MTEIKLTDVFQQVKELMTEYGIGDNTLFIQAAVKQYNHVLKTTPNAVDKDISVSMWISESANNIKHVSGTNVEDMLMQLRGVLIEWKASQSPVQQIEPVVNL